MKNIHPYVFQQTSRFYSDSQLTNFQVFKDSKGIAPNVFANILTQMLTENFSPH